MRRRELVSRPTRVWPFAFHEAGERANRRGDYQEAVGLFLKAADYALTTGGANVLREKARAAENNLTATVQYGR